jgi:hypothetical protein
MSDATTAVTAQGRNAPCACGSGLRYKHCCGRAGESPVDPAAPLYRGWESFPPEERAALWQTMQRALTAQKSGRLETARTLYEEVVARAPYTFDAVHMLGVVHLQQDDLDAAEALLTRAREMMPDVEAIRQNLLLLMRRKREHEGLYSLRAIVAADILRLFGATGRLPVPASTSGFFAMRDRNLTRGEIHVVVPGDVPNAAANRNGIALAQQLRGTDSVSLWVDPRDKMPRAPVEGATEIDTGGGAVPARGTVAIFGINARTLSWLPAAADTFESIVVALDAHDPEACVDLFDRLSPSALPRIRLVARCAEMLADLGLPGAVDPMVFGAVREGTRAPAPHGRRARIGVFIPAIKDREDRLRWEMVEWLRGQGAFLRLFYPGPLPSRHIENEDEHLVSLVSEWDAWWQDLDGLFFWGAEGRMRQYDRLVFEANAADLAIVADGFGDYATLVAHRDDCALFFDPATARDAIAAVLAALRSGGANARAAG